MDKLRYYQKECIKEMALSEEFINVLRLYCGTGKTKIYSEYITKYQQDIVVIAFPRISLLYQYDKDYYRNIEKYPKLSKLFNRYIISSDHESITDPDSLLDFIDNNKKVN